MRVKLRLVMCSDEGQEETVTDVITLDKNHRRIEHLVLTLAEAKQLLSTLQRHLLQHNWLLVLSIRLSSCNVWSNLILQRTSLLFPRGHCTMSTTAPTPVTTPIPVQLSEPEFET
jgi:hypothetical protein